MRYLLDTCTGLWLCAEPALLSPDAKDALEEPDSELFLSDVSPLEIGLKWEAGKIRLPDPPRLWIEAQIAAWSLKCLPLSRDDIYRAGELPSHHRDPFDRLLVGAALNANATILTPDRAVRQYPVSSRW